MAIITKPSIAKGQAATFTLSKSELLQHPMVVADSYFSDSSNWYRVNAVYKSSPGSQYEIVEFDASLTNPFGSFSVSSQARDLFQIQKLVILDFDGGFLEIPRSQLTIADFDISFIQAFFTVDFSQNISSLNASLASTTTISDGKLDLSSSGFFSFSLPNPPFPMSGTPLYSVRVWLDTQYNEEVSAVEGVTFALRAARLNFSMFDVSADKRERGYVDTSAPIEFAFWHGRVFSLSSTTGNFKITKIEFFQV